MVRTNYCIIACTILVAWTVASEAYPWSRVKRVSDQRLAELETLFALAARMKGRLVTVPIGYGLVDPNRAGKKKRSINAVEYDTPAQLMMPGREEDSAFPYAEEAGAEEGTFQEEQLDFQDDAVDDHSLKDDTAAMAYRINLPSSLRRGRAPYYDWRAILRQLEKPNNFA